MILDILNKMAAWKVRRITLVYFNLAVWAVVGLLVWEAFK